MSGRSKVIPKIDPHLIPKTHLQKATWESLNEGVHERVNFDDTIWGFDLAGGSKYGIPLRVMRVKPDSRAEKAGIRKGDKLKRINDIQTETLTLQEAHDMIIESGIYIRLAVSAPEDTDTTFSTWQDEYDSFATAEAERLRQEELARKRIIICKTNSHWNLMWPWTTRKTYIYRESNCFLVPSAYEVKNPDKIRPKEVEAKKIVLLPSDEIEKRSNPPTPEAKENGPPKLDETEEKKTTTPIPEEPEENALEYQPEETLEDKATTPVAETKVSEENKHSQPQMNGVKENGQVPEYPKTDMAEKLDSDKPAIQPETKEFMPNKNETESENINQEPDTEEHKLTPETEKDYDKLVAELLEEENVEAKDNHLTESTEEQKSKTNEDETEAESNEVEAEATINGGEAETKEEDDTESDQINSDVIDINENGLANGSADENEPEIEDLAEEDSPQEDAPEKHESEAETETEKRPLVESSNLDEPENVEPDTKKEDQKETEIEEEDEPVENERHPDTDEVGENKPSETFTGD